jgi:hypothetical protein
MDVSFVEVGVVGAVGTPPAFYAVFGVFLAALVVLAVVTVRWAVRRDRAGRAEWVRRRAAAEHGGSLDGAANGHAPSRAPRQTAGAGARAAGRDRPGHRRARSPRPRP